MGQQQQPLQPATWVFQRAIYRLLRHDLGSRREEALLPVAWTLSVAETLLGLTKSDTSCASVALVVSSMGLLC